MLRFLFWMITLYFLYRLVFHFIIPIFRVSRQVKSQMREFQDRMQESQQTYPGSQHTPTQTQPKSEKAGDYIDFEEVK